MMVHSTYRLQEDQCLVQLSANIATPSAVAEELKQNENEQNDTFETTNDVMSFLDFSETNPFGDVQ